MIYGVEVLLLDFQERRKNDKVRKTRSKRGSQEMKKIIKKKKKKLEIFNNPKIKSVWIFISPENTKTFVLSTETLISDKEMIRSGYKKAYIIHE